MSTSSAGGQSKFVANSAKNAMCLVWVRDDSKDRQNDRTVLYYSRLYYTIIHYTGLCRQSSTTCIWLKPERRVLCCCCNLSFLAKNRDSATMAMVPLSMMVHSQVAVLLPGGEARAMY